MKTKVNRDVLRDAIFRALDYTSSHDHHVRSISGFDLDIYVNSVLEAVINDAPTIFEVEPSAVPNAGEVDYQVIHASTAQDMTNEIRTQLREGWIPLGQALLGGPVRGLYLTMTKTKTLTKSEGV